jgi:hypothetical protein
MDTSELERTETYRHPVAECDVVMKGGITSGVVYPWAVCELARTYRLRSLGGTSAGAIAAAASAAAELGRASGTGGFQRLAGLPRFLARKGTLLALFQPQPSMAWLARIAMGILKGGLAGLAGAFVSAAVGAGPVAGALLAVGALPGLGLVLASQGDPAPWRLVALSASAVLLLVWAGLDLLTLVWRPGRAVALRGGALLVAASVVVAVLSSDPDRRQLWGLLGAWLLVASGFLLAAVAASLRRAWVELPRHGFGVCGGGLEQDPGVTAETESRKQPGADHPLTYWLADEIDGLAGRAGAGPPLTFGELKARGIELAMLTSNLTHQRPYRLPFREAISFNSAGYFFSLERFRRLFPERVLRHLLAHPPVGEGSREGRELSRDEREWLLFCELMRRRGLHPLPAADDLPVVVATRLSLSFPLLLSAVALSAVDWSRKANQAARARWRAWLAEHDGDPRRLRAEIDEAAGSLGSPEPQTCWFSDGGICSNFPVHFFDQPLPSRPTFGINLRSPHPDHPLSEEGGDGEGANVWLPTHSTAGHHLLWEPVDGLGSFAWSIIETMMSWSDHAQMRLHGFWDRVAHVNLGPKEGGLNIDMPAERILRIAERGRHAGTKLTQRFATGNDPDPDPSWPGHRWLRYRSTMALLERHLQDLADAYAAPGSEPSYAALVGRGDGPPSGYRFERRAQERFARETTERLLALVHEWRSSSESFDEGAPRPIPELRSVPPI